MRVGWLEDMLEVGLGPGLGGLRMLVVEKGRIPGSGWSKPSLSLEAGWWELGFRAGQPGQGATGSLAKPREAARGWAERQRGVRALY